MWDELESVIGEVDVLVGLGFCWDWWGVIGFVGLDWVDCYEWGSEYDYIEDDEEEVICFCCEDWYDWWFDDIVFGVFGIGELSVFVDD